MHTFSVTIQNEVPRIDNNVEELTKITSDRLQFINSARFKSC